MLIAVSHGHEMWTPGKRTPKIKELGNRVIHENEFNKATAIKLMRCLKNCGFQVLDVSSTNDDSLFDRVNRANLACADAFVAIHYNAFDGQFNDYDPEGLSVHVYPGAEEDRKLAECIHSFLVKGSVQKDRGIKESDFYVLRNTKMPAILSENGFMDNKKEALLMLDESFQEEVAVEHCKGICQYFGLPYVADNQLVPEWARSARNFVINNKISDGNRPKDNVSRQEIWCMLERFKDSLNQKKV